MKIPQSQWIKYLFLASLGRADDCPPKTGPYQDYPYFRKSNLEEIREFWKTAISLIKSGMAPKDIGLYLHWPFCASQCTFCFCSMKVPENYSEMRNYVDMLKREMDTLKDLFYEIQLTSVWIGGGTPTFIANRDLDDLLTHLRTSFQFEKASQFYVEASPATLTESKLEILLSHGVNRVTLGVQSLDGKVISLMDRRGQTLESVERALELLSRNSVVSDVDFVVGLDGQDKNSFLRDVAWILKAKPDVAHLYGFDPRPQTLFAGKDKQTSLSWADMFEILEAAEKILLKGGYRHPVWLPGTDRLEYLEEKQCGGMTKVGASVLGFGPVAQSRAFGAGSYQHPPLSLGPLDTKKIPDYICFPSNREDEMWQHVVRSLSRFHRLSRAEFKRIFRMDVMEHLFLAERLKDLEDSGFIYLESESVSWRSGDILTRQTALRHLYSMELEQVILRAYQREFVEFLRAFPLDPHGWEEKLRRKVQASALERIYLNVKAAARLEVPCVALK